VGPRRATASDLDAIVETLVASHLDYVWEVWALPGPERRERLNALVRLDLERLAIPYREVWMHDDAASVAVWVPTAAPAADPRSTAEVGRAARETFGSRLAVIDAVDAALAKLRPIEPHWFLATMGTRPDRQRQGFGSAVLRPVLAELDRIREPACLETSSAGNVAFYETLGFSVVAHSDDLPADAPETWVMWRAPDAPERGAVSPAAATPTVPTRFGHR
jgi:GNAT superfamily N-acetyltransferase